jgi:hypothetical protein
VKSKIQAPLEESNTDSRPPAPNLQAFAENVWLVEGPLVRDMGVWFTTRMTLVKLTNGSLWLDSPVSVPSSTFERIRTLGPVKYLVAGTPRHVWRLEEWHAFFPDAEVWGPPQILNKFKPMVVAGRQKLPFAGILGDRPPNAWADDIDQLLFKGNSFIKEAMFFHRRSRTIILDDLIQNHPIVKGKHLLNALWKLEGITYPSGGVPLDIRLTFTNRKLARRSLEKLLSWDFDKLIIAHGVCIEKDAKPFVEHAFQWLA